MILQALVKYYEVLAKKGEIPLLGWSTTKVSYGLDIDADGKLLDILTLKTTPADVKKQIPREIELPSPVKRTVGVAANFLWDNAIYLLGLDIKGNPERTKQCFEAAKELHLRLLGESDDPFAKAICAFFENWEITNAAEYPCVRDKYEELAEGGNVVFTLDMDFPHENEALKNAWQQHYNNEQDGIKLPCLITGENVVPELIHPNIKNVRGAQSSGASIISFNAPAFCSYNREQNLNAPIGKYAAFAYTTALNQLLADRENVFFIGDSSVISWTDTAESAYSELTGQVLNGGENNMTDDNLHNVVKKLAQGIEVDWNGVKLNPNNQFYILGLSPNASRISVRFFLHDTFGNFMKYSQEHYDRLEIVKPEFEPGGNIPLWKLFLETVNPNSTDKKSSSPMSGDTLRAILTGGRYPTTLYQSIQLRIRADRIINYRRAAIIKAYLLRNTSNETLKEVLTVQLNEESGYQPYVLGRMFAVLEEIQEKAIPEINTTIKDKYLTSACATPAKIFPILLDLAQKHLRKLDTGVKIYYSKQLGTLTSLITESYPVHHSIEDMGIFQLGYYHQNQKRYEKKN